MLVGFRFMNDWNTKNMTKSKGSMIAMSFMEKEHIDTKMVRCTNSIDFRIISGINEKNRVKPGNETYILAITHPKSRSLKMNAICL